MATLPNPPQTRKEPTALAPRMKTLKQQLREHAINEVDAAFAIRAVKEWLAQKRQELINAFDNDDRSLIGIDELLEELNQ